MNTGKLKKTKTKKRANRYSLFFRPIRNSELGYQSPLEQLLAVISKKVIAFSIEVKLSAFLALCPVGQRRILLACFRNINYLYNSFFRPATSTSKMG